YTLDWLADSLDLSSANDKEIVIDHGLGRNCQLFEQTRKWAYRAIRQGWPAYEQWQQACFERAKAYNFQFLIPLDDKEIFGIAKSIAKWTYSKFSQESFDDYVVRTHTPEIQRIRGFKSGVSRRKMSLEEKKPWVKLGISRRSYFYLKKAQDENIY
ncbi:primase C-terminal domain-containing protein, partial [Escherichia coli]